MPCIPVLLLDECQVGSMALEVRAWKLSVFECGAVAVIISNGSVVIWLPIVAESARGLTMSSRQMRPVLVSW